ncbi:MAG: hypothetical protein KDD78_02005 [Caldilineaceae bacterium]|nr:hypothetical protein [Caldilineaceae bacterium]
MQTESHSSTTNHSANLRANSDNGRTQRPASWPAARRRAYHAPRLQPLTDDALCAFLGPVQTGGYFNPWAFPDDPLGLLGDGE